MMLQLNRRFRYNWKVTLFCLLCLAVFVHLGIWQLTRSVEKENLLAQLATRRTEPPLTSLALPTGGNLNGIRIALSGTYDEEKVLLLDNRVHNGRVGYEVAHLFHDVLTDTGFLVNRGFIPMLGSRAPLPDIPPVPQEQMQVTGRVHQPAKADYLLRADTLAFDAFPVLVQSLNLSTQSWSAMVPDSSVYPYVIRLDEDQPGALPRYWQATMSLPQRHRGYAIQWFAMAAAVCLLWLLFSFRRRNF